MIQLVGPGGAGKTTVGRALADRLGVAFVDLDQQFRMRVEDISAFLEAQGYAAYCRRNVQTYIETVGGAPDDTVVALSSGFMTYADDVHPDYPVVYRAITTSPTTFVLLPSFDREACVAETVRRQLTRPFSRSAEREEQVIRARFDLHRALACPQIETSDEIETVVDRLTEHVLPNIRLQPTAAGATLGRRG